MKFFFKLFFGLLLFIILVFGASLYFIKIYADTEFAEKKINEFLMAASDSTYQIELGNFEFDFLARSVRLEQITISHISHPDYPDISGHISLLFMNDINLYQLIRKRDLHFNRFEISEPDLRIDMSTMEKMEETDKSTQNDSLFIQGSEFFINSGALTLITDEGNHYDFVSFSTQLLDFAMPSNASLPVAFDNIASIRFLDVDVLYEDQTKQIRFSELSRSMESDLITLQNFMMSPLEDYPEFFQQQTIRKNHITLNVEKADIKAFQVTPFLTQQFLDAESIDIVGMDFSFVKDYRLEPPPIEQHSPMPSEFLDDSGYTFHIPNISIDNSVFSYSEIAEKGVRPGTVTFNDVGINISNFKYSPDSDEEVEFTVLDISTNVQNAISVTSQLKIKLNDRDNYVEASGFLKDADATLFSDVAENIEGVQILSGDVDSLRFDFIISDQHADGWAELRYRNAKIKIVDKADGEQSFRERITSFSTSTFILRDNNHEPNPRVKRGTIDYENEEGDSFLKFLWRSIRSGIFDTAMRIN